MTRAKRFREKEIPASTIILNNAEANERFLNTGDIPTPQAVQYDWACGVCKNQIGHGAECTPARRDALADMVEQRRGDYRAAKMRRLGLSTAVGVASTASSLRAVGRAMASSSAMRAGAADVNMPQANNSIASNHATSTGAMHPANNSASEIASIAARQLLSSIAGNTTANSAQQQPVQSEGNSDQASELARRWTHKAQQQSSGNAAQQSGSNSTSNPAQQPDSSNNNNNAHSAIQQADSTTNNNNHNYSAHSTIQQAGSSSTNNNNNAVQQSGSSSSSNPTIVSTNTTAASVPNPNPINPITRINTVVSALLAPQLKIPPQAKVKKAAIRMIVDNEVENERFLNTGQVKGKHTQYKWACGVCKSRNKHCGECSVEKREALEEQIKQRRTGYKAAYTARVEELRQVENAPAPKHNITPSKANLASSSTEKSTRHRDRKKAAHRMIMDSAEENVRFLDTGNVTGSHAQYVWACGVCRVTKRHTGACTDEIREALANEVEVRRIELLRPGGRHEADPSLFQEPEITAIRAAARRTLSRNLAFQPYTSKPLSSTTYTSSGSSSAAAAAPNTCSTISGIEVQRIARRVQRRLDGLPALNESEEQAEQKKMEEEQAEKEAEEEEENFPAVWDRIHGTEAVPATGDGDGEGDEAESAAKPEYNTMRHGLALADKYCRDRCAGMPRMKGLQIKDRLLVTGPNCVQMRELFPDPVIMDKQEDEWFVLRGSAAVYWDPGMYFSHLFDMSTAKCVACGETSKQTCIHCPDGVDKCVCEEGVGVENDKRMIARRGWTSGFQSGMRIDGGVDLIKTVSYKHRHCRAAQANGRRATHFTSLHPAFFKQLPTIVQRSLGFVVDPSSRTLASHNVARLATSLTQQHGLSWRACSRLLNSSSETLLKEKDDDQRVMSFTRRTKTTTVVAAVSPGPLTSNAMSSPEVIPLSVKYERQMTSSLITQKRVARMVRQNLARLHQKEVATAAGGNVPDEDDDDDADEVDVDGGGDGGGGNYNRTHV